jgi:hypothetical protein
MQNAYIVTGHLIDGHTVALDEELPISSAQVRLVVEPVTTNNRSGARRDALARIRARQQARGFVPPTAEDVATYLNAERDSWD